MAVATECSVADLAASTPQDIRARILEMAGGSAASISAELSDEILEGSGSGSLPADSPFLLGRPAALLGRGVLGIDSQFGNSADAAGHLVVTWLATNARASKMAQDLNAGTSLCRLPREKLDHPKVLAALDRCAQLRCGAASFEALCAGSPAYAERADGLKRCFFQVARATAMYVVAPRPAEPNDAGQPPLDLGDDIGWAAQMYANRFRPVGEEDQSQMQLFLFDNAEEDNPEHLNDSTTARQWVFWQEPNSRNGLSQGKWLRFGQPMPVLHQTAASAWKAAAGPPGPSGFYVGIGSRGAPSSSHHQEALAEIYSAKPLEVAPKKGKGKGKGRGEGSDARALPDYSDAAGV